MPVAGGGSARQWGGSHRRTEAGQRGDVAGQTLELPIVSPGSSLAEAPSQLICAPGRMGMEPLPHPFTFIGLSIARNFPPLWFGAVLRQFHGFEEVVVGRT